MSDTLSERRLRRRNETSTDTPPAVDASPAAVTTPAAGEDWKPLDAKALGGVPVYVRGANGETAEAYYVRSRQRVGVKWEPVGLWRNRNGLGTRLPFEPVEYREVGFAPLFQGEAS